MSPAGRHRSATSGSTEDLGRRLAADLAPGHVVLLEGDLAAGKTVLVRGLVGGLGGDPNAVSSPTFVLLQTYDCDRNGISSLHHVDLYRLENRTADLREMGMEEILSDRSAVIAIEWPKDTLATWIPEDARVWRVSFSTLDDDSRMIEICPPEG